MQTAVRVRFSNGVFEPLSKVDLPEGKELSIIVEDDAEDDVWWIEKAVQAENSGYIGHKQALNFIIEKLV